MIRARLRIQVPSSSVSRSLAQAVVPDNRKMAGLRIVHTVSNHSAEFSILFQGEVETFILTLDDMLQCLQAAKKTIGELARKNGR